MKVLDFEGDVTIYLEDFKKTADRITPGSIDLVVTSPPYFVNKSYEEDTSWQEYLWLLWDFYGAVRKVLAPGGYACVNFGDNARGRDLMDTETFSTIPMTATHWEYGQWDGALELTGTRIWRKKAYRMGVPFVCNNHPRHIFDYEYVWTWRKPSGNYRDEVVHSRKLSQKGVLEFEEDHPLGRFEAAYPLGLPRWCMKVYSKPGDLVWDPFLGSGTTALAAVQEERRFIGSEINEDMEEVIVATVHDRPGWLEEAA